MSLPQRLSQTTECPKTTDCACTTFIDYWKQSDGEIVSNHIHQFKNDHKSLSNRNTIHLRSTQIRTIHQGNGDQSCGYYGIFFISKLSQILHHLSSSAKPSAKTADSILRLMKDLRCTQAFSSFKSQIVKELLAECKKRNTDCYPWIEDHITSGVLERVYLQFLQNNYFRKNRLQMPHNDCRSDAEDDGYPLRYDKAIASAYGFRYLYDSINLMEFSESSLKTNHLPLSTMDHLEYFFNKRFRNGTENYKIFLIGSAIHYVVAAVYRNSNGDVDLLYLDPQNNDILYKTRRHLKTEIIDKMRFESWLKYGWKLQDMRKLAMDSFRGIQFAVCNLIPNTIYNLYSDAYHRYFIRDALIKMNISNGFLGGFKSHVLAPMVRTISNESDPINECKYDGADDNDPKTGLFVGVNKEFEMDESEQRDGNMDMGRWKKDCEFVMNVIGDKLRDIELAKNVQDKEIKKHIEDIQNCSAFAKLWISTYYPSAVIDQNICQPLIKLESDTYIPTIVLKALNTWSSLMMLFANAQNRKIAQIEDDKFWKRLASTLLVVQMVSQTSAAMTKL